MGIFSGGAVLYCPTGVPEAQLRAGGEQLLAKAPYDQSTLSICTAPGDPWVYLSSEQLRCGRCNDGNLTAAAELAEAFGLAALTFTVHDSDCFQLAVFEPGAETQGWYSRVNWTADEEKDAEEEEFEDMYPDTPFPEELLRFSPREAEAALRGIWAQEYVFAEDRAGDLFALLGLSKDYLIHDEFEPPEGYQLFVVQR